MSLCFSDRQYPRPPMRFAIHLLTASGIIFAAAIVMLIFADGLVFMSFLKLRLRPGG